MKLFVLPVCALLLSTACSENETAKQPVQSPLMLCSPGVDLPLSPTPLVDDNYHDITSNRANGLVAFYHADALNRLQSSRRSVNNP